MLWYNSVSTCCTGELLVFSVCKEQNLGHLILDSDLLFLMVILAQTVTHHKITVTRVPGGLQGSSVFPSIVQPTGETFWTADGVKETSSSLDVCIGSLHRARVTSGGSFGCSLDPFKDTLGSQGNC